MISIINSSFNIIISSIYTTMPIVIKNVELKMLGVYLCDISSTNRYIITPETIYLYESFKIFIKLISSLTRYSCINVIENSATTDAKAAPIDL